VGVEGDLVAVVMVFLGDCGVWLLLQPANNKIMLTNSIFREFIFLM
jgi:hypothetical protein